MKPHPQTNIENEKLINQQFDLLIEISFVVFDGYHIKTMYNIQSSIHIGNQFIN